MPENVPTEFAEKSTTRQLRDIAMARTADPILSFDYIKGDLGIAHATFHRSVRHLLPVIQLSTRRLACGAATTRLGSRPASSRGWRTEAMYASEEVARRPNRAGEVEYEYSVGAGARQVLNGSRIQPRVAPETFRTSRLLDFATRRELTAQIGHQPEHVAPGRGQGAHRQRS